ncbi:oxidoreductase, aldo/keto reductase family protein [Trichuris suis]|nr:oxidoreductase, aldo/keto reductase family protein [Trichuris suis]
MSSKCVTLHNGLPMPMVGYGTWQGEGDALRAGLKKALEVGYRLIDTAYIYENEDVIGEVLQQWLASGSGKREDLFVTTKLPMHNHRRPDVQRSLKESLERLKLDYVDLFLVHTPVSSKSSNGRRIDLVNDHCIPDDVDHLETWKGMEDVLSEGLTRSIGLSNFNIAQMVRIMDNCTVKPHNLQVECHLYWPQFELHEFCKRHNISFTAYGPIGSPGRRNHPMARIGVDVSLVPVAVLASYAMPSKCVTLHNGLPMPMVGYGTWLGKDDALRIGLRKALEVGYRHIDTAYVYENEDVIGEVLQQWFASGSGKREDLFVTTKATYAMSSKCVTLHNGLRMPMVGYGTWQGKGDALRAGLRKALEVGYRLIDTAYVYENEDVIGEVLQQWLASGSGKREDLFVTTKLAMHRHRRADVERSLRESLERFKLDYVDLFLVHAPLSAKSSDGRAIDMVNDHCIPDVVDHLETWKGMEDVLSKGLTRSIGLSNFNIAQMTRIMDNCTVKPHNVQVECHLYWPQFEIHEFCKQRNISLTGYSPLGSPGRASHPVSHIGVDVSKQRQPMDDPLAKQIATKHGKSVAQVLLKWLVQRGIVVIPMSTIASQIVSNLQLFDFTFDDAEMKALNAISYAVSSKYVTLHNGVLMPMVGYGTWQAHGDALRSGLRKALEVGYRHIDTAYIYQNEDVIGEVLQQWFASGSGKREDVFVTTKLPWHSRRRDDVERSLKESLARLKLDYVDLYLVHTPQRGAASYGKAANLEIWKGMEDVFSKGLARSIGLSNFNIDQIVSIMDNSKVKPHNLQVECHLYWPQFELLEFCKRHNISFTAYSPLGSPGRRSRLPSEHKPLEDPLAGEIATKHGKSAAQAGIIKIVNALLSVSTTPSYIISNFELSDFELTGAEMKALNEVKIREQFFRQRSVHVTHLKDGTISKPAFLKHWALSRLRH